MQNNGAWWNWQTRTSELQFWRTHLEQGSDFILLQIRLNSWLLWRRHEETVVPRRSFQRDEIMRWAGVIRPSGERRLFRLTQTRRRKERKERGMSPQWGVLRLSSDGWRQVWSRRLWARLIVDDSARDHPQFVASLTLWRQLPGRNQWRGGSVTELTNLPLTGCQQCGRCHRHSHLSAGLSSSWTRREEDGRAHQLRHSTRTDDD